MPPRLRIPFAHHPLLARLRAAAGQRLWLSGGGLRDTLLGVPPKAELDITVGDPRALLARLALRPGESSFLLDAKRETFRITFPPRAGLAQVDITRLRAPTIEEDLRLRDFTVNALALEITRTQDRRGAALIDVTGGLDDLRRRVLRACTPQSLRDDPLRALRGVRIASGRGLRIEPATLELMAQARPALRRVSRERIRDEFFQVLQGPHPGPDTATLLRLGLLDVVGLTGRAPRLSLRRFRRTAALVDTLPAPGRFGQALVAELEQGITRRGALLLAALVRDLALTGNAGKICRRLALGTRATRLCATAATWNIPRAWYRATGAIPREELRFFFQAADHAAPEIILIRAPSAAAAGALFARYHRLRSVFIRPPLLTGTTAMRELGLAPGPNLGRILAAAKRAQDLGRFRSLAGAIRWARDYREAGA